MFLLTWSARQRTDLQTVEMVGERGGTYRYRRSPPEVCEACNKPMPVSEREEFPGPKCCRARCILPGSEMTAHTDRTGKWDRGLYESSGRLRS